MTCNKCGKEIPEGTICDCGGAQPAKKKSKLKILLLFSPLIAVAVIAILLSFGGEEESGNLGFTLAEFVERYNKTVDQNLKADTDLATFQDVQTMLKLDVEYFTQLEGLEDEDSIVYFASNSNVLNYYVIMDSSGEKVQAVSFQFPTNVTEAQLEQSIIFCKWLAEAVKPEMGEQYYTDTFVSAVENGETQDDGIAYLWKQIDGFYSYEIYYAA